MKNDKIEPEFRNFSAILLYQATHFPNSLAYSFQMNESEVSQCTYLELHQKAQFLAKKLLKKAKPGDRVIIANPPGLNFIINLFACFYAELIAVPAFPPVNSSYERRFKKIVSDCQPKIILPSSSLLSKSKIWKKFALYADSLKQIPSLIQRIANNKNTQQSKSLTNFDNTIALIQYTSGSTMDPKGVVLTHENLIENVKLILNLTQGNRESRSLSWLPPYHDMGLIGGILTPVFAGAPATLMSPMLFLSKPLIWLKIMSDEKTTVSVAPNFAYDYCVNKISNSDINNLDLSSLEVLLNGSEPIHPDTIEKFANKFSVCGFKKQAVKPCYGLAEATLLVSGLRIKQTPQCINISREAFKLHQIQLLPETDPKSLQLVSNGEPLQPIKIVDPNSLEELKENEVGEIWLSGPCVAKNYWNQPKLSQKQLNAKIKNDTTNTRYLRTGDLGFMHNKQLFVNGRIKDLIIIRGINYYPHDLEHTILHANPNKLKPGSTVALSTNLEHNTEQLIIICAIDKKIANDSLEIMSKDITQSILKEYKISPYKIIFIPKKSLLKTTSGKLRRQAIKQYYETNQLTILYQYTVSKKYDFNNKNPDFPDISLSYFSKKSSIEQLEIIKTIMAMISNQKYFNELSLNTTFSDLGLSSIEEVAFFTINETIFNIKLPMDLIHPNYTLGEFIQLISQSHINTDTEVENDIKKIQDQPSNLLILFNKVKETTLWVFISYKYFLYKRLMRPTAYKAGTIFRILIASHPFFNWTLKQSKNFAIKNYHAIDFSRNFLQTPYMRNKFFQAEKYFPDTHYRLMHMLENSSKPSILIFSHMCGWRQVIFLLIKAALNFPSSRLCFIADARFPLFSQLRKECELYYGKNWEEIDPENHVRVLSIWDKNLGIEIKKIFSKKGIFIAFPDTNLAHSHIIGKPIEVPVFNDKISLSTGILKIAAENAIPLITISHYFSITGIHLKFSKEIIIDKQDIAEKNLKKKAMNILKMIVSNIEKNPAQWTLWLAKPISYEPFVEGEKFLPYSLKNSTYIAEGNNIIVLIIANNCYRLLQLKQSKGIKLLSHAFSTDRSGNKNSIVDIELNALEKREETTDLENDKSNSPPEEVP